MKTIALSLIFALVSTFTFGLSASESVIGDNGNTEVFIAGKPVKPGKDSRKQQRESKKAVKAELKKILKSEAAKDTDINTLLLVIIAILLPPVAVLLVDGVGGPFILSIILWLLFYLPGLIYALWRIFRK